MKEIISWMKDAITTKKLVAEMTYYRVADGEIRATDGRITAGHPYKSEHAYLVPGSEFERLLSKLVGELKFELDDAKLTIKAGKSRGSIDTLPAESWDYPIISEEEWMPLPKGLCDALKKLTPFVSDNANHLWAMGITLERGWAYATNNIALAGVPCPALGSISAIMPLWAVEFILGRLEGLESWCWTEDYLGFKWANGAWLRSALIDSALPEQVSKMVRDAVAEKPTVEIDDEFRESFLRAAEVAESSVKISGDEISAVFGKAEMTIDWFTPELADRVTIWGAKHLTPVIRIAEWWSPEKWPKPAAFQGDGIYGYVVGRNA